jgi:hypothetical protein
MPAPIKPRISHTLGSVARVAVLGIALLVPGSPGAAQEPVPADWLLSGEDADKYRMRIDSEVPRSGATCMRIVARGNRRDSEWAVAVQIIDASPYRGRRVRLSGYLRTDRVGSVGLWMRIDGIIGGEAAQIAVDNAEDRRLEGTHEWTRQEIVLDVTAESVTILFGAMISGDGAVWLDDLAVEEVGMDVAVTEPTGNRILGGAYLRPPGMLAAPANLGFEDGEGP